jgi:hypothetical protein
MVIKNITNSFYGLFFDQLYVINLFHFIKIGGTYG